MMNRNLMNRQMFREGGAAFPDLSGDGKVTQKDILIGRGVVPMQQGGISLTNAQTNAMKAGRYVYDVEITSSGGTKTRVLEGQLEITPGVTTI